MSAVKGEWKDRGNGKTVYEDLNVCGILPARKGLAVGQFEIDPPEGYINCPGLRACYYWVAGINRDRLSKQRR